MDINKKSEIFSFADANDLFKLTGEFTNEVNGVLNITFQVNNLEDAYVGNGNYCKYSEGNSVSFNLNCSEESREAIINSVNELILNILSFINEDIEE